MSVSSSSKRATAAPIASPPVRSAGAERPIGAAQTALEPDTQRISRSLPGPRRGFLRLNAILAPHGPIPVGRSTWWAGVRAGRYPAPVKLGPRITAWRIEDIEALIERPEQAASSACRTRTRRLDHA